MNSLANFLSCRKSVNNNTTHTRIGDKELVIYGGKYEITDLEEFWKVYAKNVLEDNHLEYLTEKQSGNVIAIDFDFRYSYEVVQRLHTAEQIESLSVLFLEELKNVYETIDEPFNIFIMEKPNVNRVEDKNITKDGIHIIITLKLDFNNQMRLRSQVIKKLPAIFGDLPFTNNWESIYDEGLSKGTTNWQLYGSRKPGNEAYKLTNAFKCELDKTDNEFMMTTVFDEIQHLPSNELVKLLSVQNPNHKSYPVKLKADAQLTSPRVQELNQNPSSNDELHKLDFFIDNGFNELIKKNKSHADLCQIGIALNTEFKQDGLQLFLKIASQYSDNYDEREYTYKYEKLENKSETAPRINTIYYIFKKYDVELYKELNLKHKTLNSKTTKPQIGDDIIIVEDDNQCAEILVDKLQYKFIKVKGQYFFKVGNIWVCDKIKMEDILLNYILKMNMYKLSAKGNLIPYSKNVSGAKNIRIAFFSKLNDTPENNEIYEKFHSTTKGRIAFLDGVLDFKTKTFYLWEDITFEYYTTFLINRKYKEYFSNPNLELIEKIKQQVFENLFGDKLNTALHFLSRAIAGNIEDKNWATYLGNRDCGKGVLYDGLTGAFGDYVKTFELANMMYQRKSSTTETSKTFYWLIDLQFVRLAISQEVPTPEQNMKIDGTMLKKVTGGGDNIVARRNYDREDSHFVLDATFFMLGNNAINVDVKDAYEHCVEFSSVNQFKSQQQIDDMRNRGEPELLIQGFKVKDPMIKTNCLTNEDWKNAIVYLLFQNYKDYAVEITHKEEDEDNTMSLRKVILTKCIITQNKNDVVLVSKMEEHLNDCKKKIKNELESMGIVKKKMNNTEYRNKWCYIGIKLIEDENKEPEY